MKRLIVIFVSFMMLGCASLRTVGNNETYVIDPDGNKYTVGLRKDGKVKFKDANKKITFEVDNRGRESIIESLVKIYGVKVIADTDD